MTDTTPRAVEVPLPMTAGRRAALFAVRRAGHAGVDDVAEALGITVSGARQHLTALVDAGLLAVVEPSRSEPRRGRPQLTYEVTDLADALFPKAYAALTNELLGYLDDDAPGTIERIFARRRETRIAAARPRLSRKRTLGQKVAELARILDEDGYLATSERVGPGRYVIQEHNCAITAIAARYGQACTSEIDFIRAVLPEATVERTQHMMRGEPRCAYLISAGT
jgi:DeoR family transcriptional regulator, suf operon transcriptional repressor